MLHRRLVAADHPNQGAPFVAAEAHLGVAAASHAAHTPFHALAEVAHTQVQAPCHAQAEGRNRVAEGHNLGLAHRCAVEDRSQAVVARRDVATC